MGAIRSSWLLTILQHDDSAVRRRHGCEACRKLALSLMGVLCAMLLASCDSAAPGEPGAAAEDFVLALVAADAERAKALTVSDLWDEIDALIEGRSSFQCRAGRWDTTGVAGAGVSAAGNGDWEYALTYQCASEATPYCLRVNGIVVSETSQGWKITSYGDLCEATDLAQTCVEMCPP
jgi:hypothetical protein